MRRGPVGRRSTIYSAAAALFCTLASCGDGGDVAECAPDYNYINLPSLDLQVTAVTTVGGCTAYCGIFGTPTDGSPSLGCDYLTVDAVADGLCTVQVDLASGTAYQLQIDVGTYGADSQCTGMYVQQTTRFVVAPAGAADAGVDAGPDAPDASAE
jgi:hypothetical protein